MALIRYITSILLLFALSCTTSGVDDTQGVDEPSGYILLDLDVSLSLSEAQSLSTLLESGVLRIYNTTGGLVRYYKNLSEGVVDYLAVGEYSAEFTLGEPISATFDSADLSYTGESGTFKVLSQQTTDMTIDVTMQNTMLTINLDETLDSHYTSYSLVAYAANTIDEVTEDTLQLSFESSGDGYFIIPEGVENIVWKFIDEGGVVANGEITGVQRAHQYKLTLRHSDYFEVSGMTITVNGTEDYSDIFGFQPRPIVTGYGFDMTQTQNYMGEGYQLSVSSLMGISTIDIVVNGNTYVVGVDSEVSYDSQTTLLSISSEVFDAITQGGVYSVAVEVLDTSNYQGVEYFNVGIEGYVGVSDGDFWASSATLGWYTTTQVSSVSMQYRSKDSDGEEWSEWSDTLEASSADNHSWSVQSLTQWDRSSSTSSLVNILGYAPSKDYEYKFMVGGEEQTIQQHSTAATTQSIATISDPDLSCYTSSNTAATFWASANNSNAETLCTYEEATSSAFLDSQTASNCLAAGNLFTGAFSFSGSSGTAKFGQKYTWEARPKSFKVTFKATVGLDDDDKGQIYLAIVDWSARHDVTPNVFSQSNPTGVWNPSTQTSVDEGEIIACGLIYVTEDQDEFIEVEIPIAYYDEDATPGSNSYTIVIAATTSYRGDYFKGSTDSDMWIKDFKLVY